MVLQWCHQLYGGQQIQITWGYSFSKLFPSASRNAKKYYDKKAKGTEKPEPKAKAVADAKRKASKKPKA